jgi:putative ABC transport system permease protein
VIQLTLRRALRDLAQHLTILLVVTLATLLVVAAPALLVRLVDDGAREAVDEAGSRADLIVHAEIGDDNGYTPTSTVDELLAVSESALQNLPRSLQLVALDATPSVVSPLIEVTGRPAGSELTVRIGMLSPVIDDRLALVEGRLPADGAAGATEVVVSTATAEGAGLEIGSALELDGSPVALVVVGIVEPEASASPTAWPWLDVPSVLAPTRPSYTTGRLGLDVAVLTTPEGITRTQAAVGGEWDGTVRIRLDPTRFTNELQAKVIAEIGGLEREGSAVAGQTFAPVRVTSGFIQAIGSFGAQARAAVAQSSMMIAGAIAVAVLAVVLVGRLLVVRRSRELELERARGASLASIGLRSLAESAVVAVLAGAIGVAGALYLVDADPTPAIVVVAVAAIAPAVQSVITARGSWNGRRVPANRAARARTAKQLRTRRLVLEGALIALAIGSLYAIRSRGLLQTRSEGVDPLLALAPTFVGVAAVVLLLRVTPPVVRGLSRVVARSRGALGVLGAAQAGRALGALPVLALTLAVGLGVGGALLLDTVRTGQVDASWERIGADARLDAPVDPEDVALVLEEPGVDEAALLYARPRTELADDGGRQSATLIAVDENYAELAAQLPGAASTAPLALLRGSDGRLPILVDPALESELAGDELVIAIGTWEIPAQVVGTYDDAPSGYVDGSLYAFVDYEELLERLQFSVSGTSLLAIGPDAGEAVAALDRGEPVTREDWLEERSGLALVAGVQQLMIVATLATAAFALVALLASIVTGSRQRARSLALLRTLGFRARLAWVLALAELAPVLFAAIVGGVATGIVISTVIGPVLGLTSLTGGTTPPASSLSPWVVVAGATCALLLLAVATLVEYLGQRTVRLSEVLRVGG